MGAVAKKRQAVVGAKGGQAKQKQPSIASNSVPSIATARIVYLWSWGPIVGPVNGLRSVRLDGTPIQAQDGTINYPGVKWQFRSGELNQERLEGVSESSNEIAVEQELRSTAPWLHSITNPMIDAVRLRLSWPQLQRQDSSGNINGVRIDYAVDISTDNGPFQQVLTSFVDRKNITKYERSHRIELPAGSRWTIRARRITAEEESSLVQEGMYVEAIAEVVDSDQEYPLTSVGCIEYDAQQFGGDIAKIAVLMRGRIVRVPTNYNPETRAYATSGAGTSNGIWDGTFKEAYTNNPAWVFYDLVLHPYYGLGERIDATMVDRWSLYRIGQYCDQMVPDGKGGQEPRFTCNLYFQKQAEAYAVLQDLASIFHGMAYWDGSQIVVNADMPGDPTFSYSPAQILNNGAINYEGTRWRDRHTNAMVSWDNPAQGFETDKEPVFDDEALSELGAVRELSVDAFGCTSLGQAQRAGQWALMTEQLQTRGGTFRVGLDGHIPKPGQVIAVGDPMLAGRANGGRISAANGRVITLDRDVVIPTDARLLVNLPSGKSEGRVIKSFSGRNVTVMADYSQVPEAECGWVIDFDDLKVMQFYVRNVTRPEWHQFQLEVIQHEPSKFNAIDFGAVVDTRPITGIPVGTQVAPARVLLGQHVVVEQGIAITNMTIAWDAAPGAVAYDVEWRWGAREWVKIPRTGELTVDVRGIYAGQYLARVRAVSAMNVSSIPTNSILTELLGKTGLPLAVTNLTATALLFGINLQWEFPAGAEDTQRTEIWYSPNTDVAGATKLADLAYPQSDYSMQSLLAGARFFFWARLVDRSGNVGPFFPVGTGVMGQASSDAGPILDQIAGEISETELGKGLLDRIDLIDGPPSLPGSVSGRIKELDEQISEVTDHLQERVTEGQQALAEAQEAFTEAQGTLTEAQETLTDTQAAMQLQLNQVSTIAKSGEYQKDKAYAVGASTRLNDRLYQAKIAVPVDATGAKSPPNTTYWLDVGQVVMDSNGLASRVSTTETKITSIEGVNTSQGTAITGLNNSLTTTNTNVTAAQTAANAANTLAGGKGKVIVQAAAPAVADQLAQNLWIDITGGANTPKRWTGSAWVAVTDKVATDAATAAANALSVANTKADAAALTSLTTRVESAEGTISSQGTSITGLNNSLTTTNTNVTAAQNAANAANTLAGGKGKVIVQTGAPAAADQQMQNLWIDITGGANTPKRWTGGAWAVVTDKVATDAATAAANALSVANTKADAAALTSLTTRVESTEGTISSQGTSITGLNNSLTTTNGNVTAAQNAANAANTLAGGKGKVIVQTAAPAVADQLAQNLWIDITGSANTPKRWNGSAWVAVTDKVATDAATAAANALSVANTKADAAALTSLTTRVISAEGTISSQGTSITGLNNSLTTTNGNVTAAQNAANAANTLAGGKGKVIVQTGAPAVADQQVQNLWIDITGGANTPKRWTGSAWAAVTDKVATDAATAAANALSLANTKADAAALTSLTTRVESTEGTISSQGTSITGLNNSLTTTNGNVTAAQNAANAANTLAGGKGKVIVQTGAPAAADQQVQNLWIDITGGANTPKRWTGSAWAVVTDKVATDAATAAANALSVANTKADAAALTSLTTRVTSAEGTISSQGTSITGLNNSLTTTNGNVTAAQKAANAANALAGGKGKVIVQTGAPAAADQQVQNLWIDITGGANTPKRWTGSAWAPVTDKVATDAAAAAANALSVANTKADAAALTALNSRVTSTEGAITSQSDSLTQLNNSLTRFGDNSPTSVYQSLFNGQAVDAWAKTQASTIAVESLSNVEDNVSGATLTLDMPGGANWWGATNKKIRFDPTRLYKLSVRVLQVSARAGTAPQFYAGLDCFADDGVTRVNTNGANSGSSSHYLLASAKTLVVGEWTELVTYVKGHTAGVGGSGLGTIASPKPLKAGSRYISPMVIAGYSGLGGVVALDYFTIDDVTDQVQIDATSAALASLDSTVTQQGTTLTSQGNSLTSLNNSLTATNTNVTAAQTAANAANTLAGGKGKVIVQTGAPAAADQLVQNLWIDITGGANTPKRWTGSAWAAVTDKVATDAAAAAANALSVANTKADAAALTSLTTRVTSAEGTISSQGTSITGLNNSLTTTNTNVTAAQNAANAANTLAGGKGKVIVQTGAPAAADQQMQNLWIDITGGANTPKRWTGGAWAVVTDKVATDAATAAANALSVANTKADAAAVTALNSRVTNAEGAITSQSDSLTQLNNSLSSLQGDVAAVGLDPAPNALWQFDAGVEGWTNSGSTVAWADGQVTISATGLDPTFSSPTGLGIKGGLYTKVRARVTRIAGAGWDGKLFYATPSHSVSSSYYKSLPNPMLAIGQSTVLEWDMAALSVGGSDWVDSTITQIRLDIGGASAADVFAVDWVVIGRAGPGASSAALSSIDSKVTQQGTTLTSQGTSLTSLSNSLTTTNTNVTAAQTAANAANTLAGGKGKVIVQTAAPAVADQQVQNLWIDITGGANTPKRWTGSAWAAVTDKVAADAAAAAASALTVANTKADASAVSSLTTRVTSTEQQITAQATKLDGIYVQVNPDMAGDSAGFAGATTSFVGVWSEQSARIEDGILSAKRTDTVEATANLAVDLGQQNSGAVQQVSAVVQQVSQAQITADGKASAMWSVKLQVNAQGQYVAAGVGLGVENGPAGLQGQFLVSADRFAVVNGINGTLSSPFTVQNGQVFMRSAFIEDGSIDNAKIGSYISSSDYIFGQRGWAIYKSGGFEMNGPNTGQGRMALNSSSLKFYHANGVVAIDMSV